MILKINVYIQNISIQKLKSTQTKKYFHSLIRLSFKLERKDSEKELSI